MKHIYLFNEGSVAAFYGIGTYIRQVCDCLKNRHDIRLNVVHLFSEEHEFKIIEAEGLRTYCFPNIQFPRKSESNRLRYYRNCRLLLSEYIPLGTDDELFFHFNYDMEYPLMEAIKKQFPESVILYTIHCQNWCFKLNGNTSRFKHLIHTDKNLINNPLEKIVAEQYETERKMFHCAHHLICLANFTKNLLIEEYEIPAEKISLIYNGLKDEAKTLSPYEKSLLRKKLFIPENAKIILFAGRLQEIKGADYLIRAFKLLIPHDPDAHLIIAGSGAFSTYMKETKNCRHKITFTGRLEKDELYTLYQIADVGVLPSFHEQCSYVAIEMMMFGLPVIGTTSTGLCEMIIKKENRADIIENIDTASLSEIQLAQIIRRNLNDGRNSNLYRKTYLEKYTLEKMSESLQKLYHLS
jgi:glycosyltransferase